MPTPADGRPQSIKTLPGKLNRNDSPGPGRPATEVLSPRSARSSSPRSPSASEPPRPSTPIEKEKSREGLRDSARRDRGDSSSPPNTDDERTGDKSEKRITVSKKSAARCDAYAQHCPSQQRADLMPFLKKRTGAESKSFGTCLRNGLAPASV